MTHHEVVDRAEWETARDQLIDREKEHTEDGLEHSLGLVGEHGLPSPKGRCGSRWRK